MTRCTADCATRWRRWCRTPSSASGPALPPASPMWRS